MFRLFPDDSLRSPLFTVKQALCGLLIALLVIGVSPVRGQDSPQITLGTLAPITSFDPADSFDLPTWELLSHLYTGLTRRIPGTGEYTLALAASHTVSADGLSHTFSLRPDAAFSDGTPITAQTCADSIQRTLTLMGKGYEAAAPYVEGVEVSAAGELVIHLKRPLPYLLALLSLPPFFPVHPGIYPPDQLINTGTGVIGSGVYRIRSLKADQISLEADPAWKGEAPAVPRIEVRRYPYPADLRDAALRGELDLIWRGLPDEDVAKVIAGSPQFQPIRQPVPGAFYLIFGIKEKPYNDPAARAGFAQLLDRDRAVFMGYGDSAAPLLTLLPTALAGDAPLFPAYDLKGAGAFLREHGYSPYKRIESELQSASRLYGDAYGAALNALITEINRGDIVRVGRFDTEPSVFLEQIERGTFRLMVVGWTPLVEHPDAYLRPLLSGPIAQGAGYQNDQITALLDQAALNPPNAAALYQQVQTLARADAVVIPIWGRQALALVGGRIDPASVNFGGDYQLHFERLRLQ